MLAVWFWRPAPAQSFAACRLRLRATTALALVLAVGACGGGGGGGEAFSPATPAAPPTTTTATPETVPPPLAPTIDAPLAITGTAPASYVWDSLGVGKPLHTDAEELLTAVPGRYKGLKFLRTANADRFLGAAPSIVFRTNRDVTILVAYDRRAAANRPSWLASWSDTGDTLTTSSAVYNLYRQAFAAGAVALGGNELGFNTYAVVVDDGTALGNAPPFLVGNPPSSVSANRSYLFAPTASDGDGDSLAFVARNLPSWLTLDTATGRLTGTPTAAAVRAYTDITVSVSDGESSATLGPFAVTVTPVATNSPPAISSPAVPHGTQFEQYAFQPLASDPDGDSLTFSVANRPRWATLDVTTGRLAGTPGRGDVGVDPDITISVSDGRATTSLPPFTIRVYAPGEMDDRSPTASNQAPEIFGTPPLAAVAGTRYEFTAEASDPDGDELTYSIANRPRWATFSNRGQLEGTPSWTDVGNYSSILISVTDGVNVAALERFAIVVSAAGTNVAPSISGSAPTSVSQGEAYWFEPSTNDPNGDQLTFSISSQPSWTEFDRTTGALSGIPSAADAGVYGNIRIMVSDGQSSAALAPFSITVIAAPTNLPPTIFGVPQTQVLVGHHYSFTPTAHDPDGGTVDFSIVHRPGWATFAAGTGHLSGTPTAADVGSYNGVLIRASDGSATTALPAFDVSVVEVATGSATLSWTPPTDNTDGTPLDDLAGYRIYWGTSQGNYPNAATVHNAGLTSYVVSGLTSGTWYFVVTAFNSENAESGFSNVGSRTIR